VNQTYRMFTDGSALGNHGTGGWGAPVKGTRRWEVSGGSGAQNSGRCFRRSQNSEIGRHDFEACKSDPTIEAKVLRNLREERLCLFCVDENRAQIGDCRRYHCRS
jgi:hypothetical protein